MGDQGAITRAINAVEARVLVADATMWVPPGNANRPGVIMVGGSPDEVVIHETANTNPGADAVMHGHFLAGGGGPDRVSFHAGIDALRVVQYLPWNERCYAAGDGNGPGNTDSINFEFCVNRDMDYNLTKARGAKFVALTCFVYNIPVEKIRQHNYRSSYAKDCPHFLRIGNNWALWLNEVRRELSLLTTPPVPTSRYFPETGKTLSGAFYKFWNENGGLPIFGYPIRDPKTGTIWNGATIVTQSCERLRLEDHSSYDKINPIKLGLSEQERLKAVGD